MKFDSMPIKDKLGREIIFRNAEVADAAALMMETILEVAKKAGFEQVELEVISDNHNAIALYKNLGFEKYGTFPNYMKYTDGTYANADWMMKNL